MPTAETVLRTFLLTAFRVATEMDVNRETFLRMCWEAADTEQSRVNPRRPNPVRGNVQGRNRPK